jgi:hypothetical protein
VQVFLQFRFGVSQGLGRTRAAERPWERGCRHACFAFSYPEPILRAVNGARQGALAKSISNWHLIGHNEGCCSNTGYILLPCFYGIRLWIWPEPLVAPRVRRALGTRMACFGVQRLVSAAWYTSRYMTHSYLYT